MNFIFSSLTREILFLPREHKIHIFEPTCNVLFIIWRLYTEYFRFYRVSKKSSFTNTAGLYGKQKIQKYFLVTGVKIFFKNFYVVQGFLLCVLVFKFSVNSLTSSSLMDANLLAMLLF